MALFFRHFGAVSTHVPARGGHQVVFIPAPFSAGFNTRARARRAPARLILMGIIERFQHTCPREAGTFSWVGMTADIIVSTHVPARGGH